MVTIVNYGLGNLGSIANMFKRIGVAHEITSEPENISRAGKILLPGVGAFDAAMNKIRERGLEDLLRKKAIEEEIPFMGICLGMQLMADKSEEGEQRGLGLIKGRVVKFKFEDRSRKVPHMGWNAVRFIKPNPLIEGTEGTQRFYFVHSYHMVCDNIENALGMTHYGFDFLSVVQDKNIFGAQFHPEKSHRFGMSLLRNFAKL